MTATNNQRRETSQYFKYCESNGSGNTLFDSMKKCIGPPRGADGRGGGGAAADDDADDADDPDLDGMQL